MVRQGGLSTGQGSGNWVDTLSPPLGIIEVVHVNSISVSMSRQREILSVVTLPKTKVIDRPKKKFRKNSYPITFVEANLEGMSQPHDDALVVTSRIGGFLVKRVMIDQWSRA